MRTMLGGLVAAGLVGCAAGGSTEILDTDRSAMRATTDSFTVYVVQHRDSMAASLFAEKATFMPPNQPMVQGRAAIQTWMKNFPRLSKFIASPIEITGRGDLAYIRGTFQLVFENGATDRGKYLEIRRREKNGRWLTTADIFNSDLPATATTSK